MKLIGSMLLTLTPALVFAAPPTGGSFNKACFKVDGMTCPSCSLTVKSAVKRLKGIKSIDVSVQGSEAIIFFDNKKTEAKDIRAKINEIGGDYKATVKQCKV